MLNFSSPHPAAVLFLIVARREEKGIRNMDQAFSATNSPTVALHGCWYESFIYNKSRMFKLNIADMKKLMLTGISAAFLSIAALGQEQNTDQDNRNQFRQTEEQQQQSADSISTDFRQGVNEAEQEAEQAEDNLQQESNEFRRDAREAGENIEEGAERTGNQIEEGAEETSEDVEKAAEQTGEDIEQAADETGEDIRQGVERTGDEIEEETDEATIEVQDQNGEQRTEQTLNNMNQEFRSTVDPNGQDTPMEMPEIEVVESKEGPDNQVVYKYQGEFYYVDREKQELVKAEESELEDADHRVIVKEGNEESQNNESARRNNRGQDK
jgi:hypothetical protein